MNGLTIYAKKYYAIIKHILQQLVFFIETLYKKNHIQDATAFLKIYKHLLPPQTLVELYAKTNNIHDAIATIYSENTQKRWRLINTFFESIDNDANLVEDFAIQVFKLDNSEPKDLLPIIKWLNIYEKYSLADTITTEAMLCMDSPQMPQFKIDRSLAYTPYLGSEINKPLMISFSAFETSIVNQHYASHGISKLEILHGTLDFPTLHFFHDTQLFNIIHVLDEYQVWGMLNFSQYFKHIKSIINILKPSKIITFGSSAGGFQSFLYGILLNADLAIACSPQAFAFHSYMNDYRSDINNNYGLTLSNLCYLPKIMKIYKTKTKKKIFISSGNSLDIWHYNAIKNIDDKTYCTAFDAGNTHNLFDFYGRKCMREQIIQEINAILNT
ncbi:hypothetical protein QUW15_00170 [Desulfovibrio piger]|nr:hypothetical protein [Desulfovibrio piger]